MSVTMKTFHDVLFPTRLAIGSFAGVERKTDIVRMASGHEQRNTPWLSARRQYALAAGPRPLSEIYQLAAFFEARRGALIGFRWRDWLDHKSCDAEAVPTAIDQTCLQLDTDRTKFALQKKYGSLADAAVRRITKPVVKTVKVAVGGTELAADAFQVDPAQRRDPLSRRRRCARYGRFIDVPVRFDTDRLMSNWLRLMQRA